MPDSATFTYHGPEQSVRVGGLTFDRFIATSVDDAAAIKELRSDENRALFSEANPPAAVVAAGAKADDKAAKAAEAAAAKEAAKPKT